MDYESNWEVTLDHDGPAPRVIAAIGQRITDELTIPWKQTTEQSRRLRATAMKNFGRENVEGGLVIGAYHDHANDAAARNWAAQLQIALKQYSGRSMKVRVRIAGAGETYTISDVVVEEAPTKKVIAKARTLTTWKLKGGEWTLGEPSGPDPIGLDDAPVNLSRRAGMLKTGGTAAGYQEGIAVWENAGTGDDADQATAGSQPKLMVGPALYLPGVQYNNFSSATSQTQPVFYIAWAGILPSYTPAARVCLASKWAGSVNDCQWALYIETTGQITLAVSPDRTPGSATSWTSTLPVGVKPHGFVALAVTRDDTAVRFAIYPTLEWTNPIEFSPPIVSAPITMLTTNQPLVIGSSDFGSQSLGEMRVQQVRFVPNYNTGGLLVMDFSGRRETTGTSGIERRYAGTDPMVEMIGTDNFCARFDGTNDSLTLPSAVKLNAVSGCSIFLFGQILRTIGTNDLIFLGSNDADPRILLRMEGGTLKLIVRRLDGEATALVSTAVGVGSYWISTSIDYAAGTATLYTNRVPRAVGSLTSAGLTSATDSSETRVGAGQGGSNPANLDVLALHIVERATDPFEHDAIWQQIQAENGF